MSKVVQVQHRTTWFRKSLNWHIFKVNNRNTRTRCEMSWKLTIKTPEWCHWHCSGVFIVNFEQVKASWEQTFNLRLHHLNNLNHNNKYFTVNDLPVSILTIALPSFSSSSVTSLCCWTSTSPLISWLFPLQSFFEASED